MPQNKQQLPGLMKKKSKQHEFANGPIKREYLPPEIYKYAKTLHAKSMKDFIKRLDYNYMKENKLLTKKLQFSKILWDFGCGELWIEKLNDTIKNLKDDIELSEFQIYFLRALIAKYRKMTKEQFN